MTSSIKGKTKNNGLYPKNCGFQKGHPKYSSVGDFKKGMITWNAGTSVWIECKCLACGKEFKIRKCHMDRNRRKYCSKKCFIKGVTGKLRLDKRQRSIKNCQQCNKPFEIRPCEKDKKFCSKTCASNSRIGIKRTPFTEEHKRKIGEANKLVPHLCGEKHPRWKGGITSIYNLLRTLEEYNKWRMDCLRRDWFKCRECYIKENLEVHHIESFTNLVNEFLQEYNQFSIIDDRETLLRLAITYKPFWNISNGITFCEKHHKELSRSKI